ncbi:hypothetical protein JNO48_10650 [Clostridiales bacterium]|nr:hypothetical protein JNO48_10650 [Clostridiales bacterium]
MAYNHWFVSRQKRKLTTVYPALIAYSDVCEGHIWERNIQLQLEDELANRAITDHGSLRARRNDQGGGGTRTLFKQMKDLGLVFLEENNKKCRLTLIGEDIVSGNITFVEAMRLQLQRYQYPSATVWNGRYGVSHEFKVHPFQFLFRLLKDPRLDGYISMEETAGIIIFEAKSDDDAVFQNVVEHIIRFRNGDRTSFHPDTKTKTYKDIANTLFNYIGITQYIDRDNSTMHIRKGKEQDVEAFITNWASFIPNPELSENYQRRYGRGNQSRDLRNFERETTKTQRARNEARIRREYIILSLHTPITKITSDVVRNVTERTGVDERIVRDYLTQNYPHGNLDDFFMAYREMAHMGRSGAAEFEMATKEMFTKVFNMNAKWVGPIGNTPDVFVESATFGFCGIIDNKAYKDHYSINGNHKRIMEDVYIPRYQTYGETVHPLAFFSYIAGSFGTNIDSQIDGIRIDTGINGSAMPVDILIDFAQDYIEKGYNHNAIQYIFSVNKEASIADLEALNGFVEYSEYHTMDTIAEAAENTVLHEEENNG